MWEVFRVRELIEQNILFPPLDGNHGQIHPKSTDFIDKGIPFIMASDIDNYVIDFNNCKFITEEQARTLRKGFAKTGDVLLTHKATIGKTALIKDIPYEFIMLTPQVTYYRVKNPAKLDNRYLKFYFSSVSFQELFKNWAGSGGTRAYLGILEQQKLPIIVPPLPTQQKIADILSAYDDLIENNNRRIEVLEKVAQNLYKEWFVRFRFPDYKETKIEDGLPQGWTNKKLTDIANVKMGQSPKSENYNENGIGLPFHQGVSYFNRRFPTHKVFCTDLKKTAKKGDILLSVRAPVGRINIANTKLVIGRGLCSIEHKNKYNTFLYYQLNEFFHKEDIIGNGAVFNAVGKDELLKINLILPDRCLIEKFEGIVKDIDNEIDRLDQKNRNLTRQRDLLLPRLMSGKLEI